MPNASGIPPRPHAVAAVEPLPASKLTLTTPNSQRGPYGSGDTEAARDAARVSWWESIRLSVTVVAIMRDKLQQCLVDPAVVSDRSAMRQEQYNIEYLLSLLPRYVICYSRCTLSS